MISQTHSDFFKDLKTERIFSSSESFRETLRCLTRPHMLLLLGEADQAMDRAAVIPKRTSTSRLTRTSPWLPDADWLRQ